MTMYLQKEIEGLKKRLLSLTAVVESAVQQAIRSIKTLDAELAASVCGMDDEIDRLEIELEEECLKILALHQPVANDLRYIVAVLKINNDLERIGDLAGNIAERTISLIDLPRIKEPFNVAAMADRTEQMLDQCLDALVTLDTRLAKKVLLIDDEIDRMHAENYAHIKDVIRADINQLDSVTNYLTVSRHLERIADLATNIAEDIYYMITGEIVRHSTEWTTRAE